jgi:PAS domain S-box-containing protein
MTPRPDRLLELLFTSTPDYAMILLDAEGRVRHWNEASERLFGFSRGEMLGQEASRIFTEPDRRAGVPEVELRTAREQGRAEDERWHVRKDGTRFWGSGIMIGLHEDGRLVGFGKVVRDLTERRRLEDAVRESQRLESLGVLAAGVAHDFNNVLTAIMGNVSMARRALNGGSQDPAIRMSLVEAERAAQRAADLVRQLLNYAGKGRRVVRPVDVCGVARDALAIVRASVSPGIRLDMDVPEDCPPVEADVGQLQQLLLNLILNAAESIEGRAGRVAVRLRVRSVPEDELRGRYPGFALGSRQYLELRVQDDGRGMDQATLRQIFDPFFTTKFLGRGLGLAAALGIVRSHGGGISVESAPGRGSTFTVLLPAEESAPAPRTVAEAVADSARGDGLVLVVDDEPAVRSLVERTVADLGYTAVLAENGRQALDIFERVGHELVAVLLDLAMPVMDGADAALRLQRRRPSLPILVMSGLADDDALERLGQVQVAGFIAKPFNPEQLAQNLAVALRLSAR